ncbi:RNA cap guanine-N2 methyltransferase-domain-containing protein [Crepidotus variabilis]|uniref:Trimethylguanosine synthase n=1 Tax=Crepidotus variabilis TaxID=179855 RepID=A0A9P6JL62_9AGAR|nr:RNA cap guanine-N2 methyltransferase-domain-containing protein [Crepidotus variabilis]
MKAAPSSPDEPIKGKKSSPTLGPPEEVSLQSDSEPPLKKSKCLGDSNSLLDVSRLLLSRPDAVFATPQTGKYDASGLVPHYFNEEEVPDHLKKYFYQRVRYFSLYSTPPGCLLDEEGWYSVTPELVADQIAERCRCDTILDAFCGVGGNAIAFAKTCQRVIALDISTTRLALARHNAQIYGVADRIEFILCDYRTFVKSQLCLPSSNSSDSRTTERRKIDVVFLSPPWGGPSYLGGDEQGSSEAPIVRQSTEANHPSFSLANIKPEHGSGLFDLARQITKNVAYYLPRNTRLEEIGVLLTEEERRIGRHKDGSPAGTPDSTEQIEVEEEWMGNKLKAITCYFGGLVEGQGDMF